jgi:hypothetical protein
MLPRRTVLQSVLAGISWTGARARTAAQTPFGPAHRVRLLALADAVLPQDLGADGHRRAVDQFLSWVRDYRNGAERDHGYGVTAIRVLPASPAARYVADLDDLDRRAGGSFAAGPRADRQRWVTEAVEAAKVRDLPARPNGGHLATDLMSLYFRSAAANDRAYGRAIGREACRDLAGSDDRPRPLARDGGR